MNINLKFKNKDLIPLVIVALIVLKRYLDIIAISLNISILSKVSLAVILLLSFVMIKVNKKYNKLQVIFTILMFIQFMITGNGVLFFSSISILAIKNTNFKKVINVYFYSNLVLFLVVIGLNQIGILPRYFIDKYNDLGFGNPNTCFISFYAIWLSFLYLNFKKLNFVSWLALITSPMIMYSITKSTTGLLTALATIIITSIVKYGKIEFNNLKFKNIVVKYICYLVPIVLMSTSLLLTYKYKDDYKLNEILSSRPYYWGMYMNHREKHLNLIGYDNNIRETLFEEKVPLDSGYIFGLYTNGIIIFTLLFALLIYTLITLSKTNKKVEIIMIISVLIYSFAETVTFDLSTNIYLVLLYLSLEKSNINNKKIT